MLNEKQNDKLFVLNDSVVFDLIVFLFFLVITIGSFEYNPRARAIPLGLGILGSVLMFLQLLSDAIPRVGARLRFVSQSGLLEGEGRRRKKETRDTEDDAKTEKNQRLRFSWWKAFRLILWLAGFVVILSFTNYLIAVGLFIVLITKIEAGENWKRALLLACCVDGCFFILFDILLQVHL